MSLSAAIVHLPSAHRRPFLERVVKELARFDGESMPIHVETRAGSHSACDEACRWSLRQDVTHCLFLDDDAILAPRFCEILRAMTAGNPDNVISLHSVHPRGPEMAAKGHRWYSTHAWLVGVGYVFPRALLEKFVDWRDGQPWGFIRKFGHDALINEWHGHTRRNVYHPVPTILQHDLSVPSTMGAEPDEPHRLSTVTWENYEIEQLIAPEFWRLGLVPHLLMPHEGG